MRVPNVGLPLDERRIVREGYEMAERLMANYRDPPGVIETIGIWLADFRHVIRRLLGVNGFH